MEQSLYWEASCSWASQKFPAFYVSRKFLTVCTTARNFSLSWAKLIKSTLTRLIYIITILILSSHLTLALPGGLFPSGFLTKVL